VATYRGHHAELSVVQHTPDGKWIASADIDGTVKVWDITACKLLFDTNKSRGTVSSLAFHPLDQVLAIGSGRSSLMSFPLISANHIASIFGGRVLGT
jgi:WD40 repeat protein